MRIDLVIFDCDGVLVDSEPITSATWVDAAAELGVSWTLEEHLDRFRGGTMADVVAALEAELGSVVPEDFVESFRARLFNRLRSDVKTIPGVEAALDAIAHPICVASNGPHSKMEATLGSTGLISRFEGRIFSAYEIGQFKPDPGLFLHAAHALGATPLRCVVVEDSDAGREAALAAGMHALLYDAESGISSFEGATRFTDMNRLPELLERICGLAS